MNLQDDYGQILQSATDAEHRRDLILLRIARALEALRTEAIERAVSNLFSDEPE